MRIPAGPSALFSLDKKHRFAVYPYHQHLALITGRDGSESFGLLGLLLDWCGDGIHSEVNNSKLSFLPHISGGSTQPTSALPPATFRKHFMREKYPPPEMPPGQVFSKADSLSKQHMYATLYFPPTNIERTAK